MSGVSCLVSGCPTPADADSPVALCRTHLLAASDWVVSDVGVTDLLPSPCLACGSRLGVRYPSGWVCAICDWRVGDIPDAQIATVRVDVVYYIRFGDRVKIGTSGNVRGRMSALPHDEILAFERGTRTLEQRRHAQFAAHRIGSSEWFRADDALLEHARDLRAGVDDPWDNYAFWVSRELALGGA